MRIFHFFISFTTLTLSISYIQGVLFLFSKCVFKKRVVFVIHLFGLTEARSIRTQVMSFKSSYTLNHDPLQNNSNTWTFTSTFIWNTSELVKSLETKMKGSNDENDIEIPNIISTHKYHILLWKMNLKNFKWDFLFILSPCWLISWTGFGLKLKNFMTKTSIEKKWDQRFHFECVK